MSYLLIQDEPLLVSRKLASIIGLNEALFLQQLHYWLTKSTHTIDGQKWVYNTYEAWAEQFPFWSLSTIRRIISSLKKRGLIQAENYNKIKSDQTRWYTIQYDAFCTFEEKLENNSTTHSEPITEPNQINSLVVHSDSPTESICTNEEVNLNSLTDQAEQDTESTWTDEPVNLDNSLPKITSKNTPENSPKITSKIYSKVDEDSAREDEHNPFRFFENNGFGVIGSFISEKISAWCTDLSDELVVIAMELAVENGCKTWKYVEAILRDWVDKGFQSREDVETAQLAFREKKKKPSQTPFDDDFVTRLRNGDTDPFKQPERDIDFGQLKQELEEELKLYKVNLQSVSPTDC